MRKQCDAIAVGPARRVPDSSGANPFALMPQERLQSIGVPCRNQAGHRIELLPLDIKRSFPRKTSAVVDDGQKRGGPAPSRRYEGRYVTVVIQGARATRGSRAVISSSRVRPDEPWQRPRAWTLWLRLLCGIWRLIRRRGAKSFSRLSLSLSLSLSPCSRSGRLA
jgi:hypothetical protein